MLASFAGEEGQRYLQVLAVGASSHPAGQQQQGQRLPKAKQMYCRPFTAICMAMPTRLYVWPASKTADQLLVFGSSLHGSG